METLVLLTMLLVQNKILQWNINGCRGKLPKLEELIKDVKPKILVLQETKIADDKPLNIKNYKLYRKGRTNHGGGICTAIHESLPSQVIPYNSELEILVCKVMLKDCSINICNVYFPNDVNVTLAELNRLIKEIPYPRLILGDFNAKHGSWGSEIRDDYRGILLNDWAIDSDLHILNDGSLTRYDRYLDSYSHIDISFIDNRISSKFSWETYPNRAISDHFPIVLDCDFGELYLTKTPRWLMEKANWIRYRSEIQLPSEFTNADDDCEVITNILIQCSKKCIPQTSRVINTKYANCWWNSECQAASDSARRQFSILKRNNTLSNVSEYNRLEAISTSTLLDAKRQSWAKYVGAINRNTKIKDIWHKINAISGKNRRQGKIIINDGNEIVCDPVDISHKLGEFFSFINSDDNYDREFLILKQEAERVPIVFPNGNTGYNRVFEMSELELALKSCTGSSPGPEDLHYEMFKQLSLDQKICILNFFNFLWTKGVFPDRWREAIVIPIPKPCKDPSQCTSYRPIFLTSCFCKILEKW